MLGIVAETLEESVGQWQEIVDTEFPAIAKGIKVVREIDPKKAELWKFSTDKKNISNIIGDEGKLEKIFMDFIVPLYKDTYGFDVSIKQFLKNGVDASEVCRNLLTDNFTSLNLHEILHFADCPVGKEDERNVDLAIYRAIKSAMPRLSKKEIVIKGQVCRNAVWDFVIDTTQFALINSDYIANDKSSLERRVEQVAEMFGRKLDVNDIRNLPDGVIPMFDYVSMYDAKGKKTKFFPLTRAIYGTLFAKDPKLRKNLYDYFMAKVKESGMPEGEAIKYMTKALKGIVEMQDDKDLAMFGIDMKKFSYAVDEFYKNLADDASEPFHKYIVDSAYKIFRDRDRTRYKAIEGFIKPLAELIPTDEDDSRQNHGEGDGTGGGTSGASSFLDNLLDGLGQDEAQQLLAEMANDPNDPTGGKGKKPKGGGSKGGLGPATNLTEIATDEYYKLAAKPIDIKSPKRETVSVDLGPRYRLKKKRTVRVAPEGVPRAINDAGKFYNEFRIFPLRKMPDGSRRWEDWRVEETRRRSYTTMETGIEIADNIIFVEDTSGTMGQGGTGGSSQGKLYVGSGNRMDALQHVNYGVMKTMVEACSRMKKKANLWFANYSGSTIIKGPYDLVDFYSQQATEAKTAFLTPQYGGTELEVGSLKSINSGLKGKNVWILTNDGDMQGNCQGNIDEVVFIAQQPNNAVVVCEIYDSGVFGNAIRPLAGNCGGSIKNLSFYHFGTLEDMTNTAVSFLIQYS